MFWSKKKKIEKKSVSKLVEAASNLRPKERERKRGRDIKHRGFWFVYLTYIQQKQKSKANELIINLGVKLIAN
jgi:hypothetical protein